ncbi:tetraspanin 74F [Arctopsyche grandis]|uniref:tetraspanin 74F n=1 Tax=Arctopsyche grandis TaxID=121162 RepID=UPI00406D8976
MGFGQEMDGCGRCMKYGLFVANFLTFLGGLVVLAIGLWMLIDRTFINDLIGTNLFQGSIYVLIATGALITFISFFGCMGAAKEIKCLLLTYNILVFILFVTLLVGGILGYVFREKVQTTMEKEMQSSISFYGNREEFTKAWDTTQQELMCCGVNNYKDWQERIPESCCREVERGGRKLPCTQAQNALTIYTEGCLRKGVEFMKENGVILGTAGIVVAVIMIFGIIFSCVLFMKIE